MIPPRKRLYGEVKGSHIKLANKALVAMKGRMRLGGLKQMVHRFQSDGVSYEVLSSLGQDIIKIVAPDPINDLIPSEVTPDYVAAIERGIGIFTDPKVIIVPGWFPGRSEGDTSAYFNTDTFVTDPFEKHKAIFTALSKYAPESALAGVSNRPGSEDSYGLVNYCVFLTLPNATTPAPGLDYPNFAWRLSKADLKEIADDYGYKEMYNLPYREENFFEINAGAQYGISSAVCVMLGIEDAMNSVDLSNNENKPYKSTSNYVVLDIGGRAADLGDGQVVKYFDENRSNVNVNLSEVTDRWNDAGLTKVYMHSTFSSYYRDSDFNLVLATVGGKSDSDLFDNSYFIDSEHVVRPQPDVADYYWVEDEEIDRTLEELCKELSSDIYGTSLALMDSQTGIDYTNIVTASVKENN